MMGSDPDASPINPLPPVVVALVLAIVGIEVLLAAASKGFVGGAKGVGWRVQAMQEFAFSPPYLHQMIETGVWPLDGLKRFFSYAFVHYGFTHMLFVVVFLLALGKLVAETLGGWAVIVTFLVSAAVGALVYGLIAGTQVALIGGFPAVYGLIGTYTFLLWTHAARTGQGQWKAFRLIGVLLAIQLVFGALFGGGRDWIAEVAGFAAGFAIAPLVAPGGVRRLAAKLRSR